MSRQKVINQPLDLSFEELLELPFTVQLENINLNRQIILCISNELLNTLMDMMVENRMLKFYQMIYLLSFQDRTQGISDVIRKSKEILGISQATTYRRLKKLREAGILDSTSHKNKVVWNLRRTLTEEKTDVKYQSLVTIPLKTENDSQSGIEKEVKTENDSQSGIELKKDTNNVYIDNDVKEVLDSTQSLPVNKNKNVVLKETQHSVSEKHGVKKESLDSAEQTDMLPKTKISSRGPKLPTHANKVVEEVEQLGSKYPLMSRALWYWATERYKKLGINMYITPREYRSMAVRYQHITKALGEDWEVHKKFIDWYLDNTDEFIAKGCKHGFSYFSSINCVNRWEAERAQKPEEVIPGVEHGFITDISKTKNLGTWIK